jgi:CheY-like chemotaxis protein
VRTARATELPDIVPMDMSLSVMNGWEATRAIKADAGVGRCSAMTAACRYRADAFDGVSA